jgi:hypothetical protein
MKTQLILIMYETLISGQTLARDNFCMKYCISVRTFYRYIKEIGTFIMHEKRELTLNEDEPNGFYYLVKSEG